MIKNLTLLLFVFFTQIYSQNLKINSEKLNSIAVQPDDFFGYDNFDFYYFTSKNVLYKKNETQIFQYQNMVLGEITKVDIINPLKIVVFYDEFNTVVLLDNQLNEIQKIYFSDLDSPILVRAIGISGQNKIWFFNSLNLQIGLYDFVSNTYQYIGNPINDGITFYQTNFNYFQFVDSNNNWNTYTIFGRYFKNGKVEQAMKMQFIDEQHYISFNDGLLFYHNVQNEKKLEIDIVEKSIKKFFYKEQILSIFTDQGITNYKINLP